MRVIVFGATGMIGQGALIECLEAAATTEVLVVARKSCGVRHPKLREHLLPDPGDLSSLEGELEGLDACLWCLGISSVGISEAEYRRITLDMTVRAAQTLVKQSPTMAFAFVSGASTDHTGKSRQMWARVKGEAENAVLGMGFREAFALRPGIISPEKGVKIDHTTYGFLYKYTGGLGRLLAKRAPGFATRTDLLGLAMLEICEHGFERQRLESVDINVAAKRAIERRDHVPKPPA